MAHGQDSPSEVAPSRRCFKIDDMFVIRGGVWVAVRQLCPIKSLLGSLRTTVFKETAATRPPETQALHLRTRAVFVSQAWFGASRGPPAGAPRALP